MATASASINPANGRVHSVSAPSASTAQETNTSKYLVKYGATADQFHHYTWMMPGNYFSGAIVVRLKWRANATSGDCYWLFNGRFVANGESTSTTTGTTAVHTVSGSAYTLQETTFTPGTINVQPNSLLFFNIQRNADDGADTLAVDAELEEITI